MRSNALNFAFFFLALAGLVAGQLPNPFRTGSPIEAMKEKSDAAFDWAQAEAAEVANTNYRLKTIYEQNKTVPRKVLTLLNTSLSYFDAAWARAREARLRPDTTSAVYKEMLNQYDCVTTPAEFVAAFNANTPRCVSDDLVARLSSGPDVATARNRSLTTNVKAANFYSGSDALAKYLRIGFPKSVGINTPQDPANLYNTQSYMSANFAGLKEYRNGQGLVNGVGYSAVDWSVTDTYSLAVFSKSAIRAAMRTDDSFYQDIYINANVNGLRPYWNKVKLYFDYTYQPFGFKIPQVAIDLIANQTFTQLTGCGAQCSWTPATGYPSNCYPRGVYAGKRLDPNTCGLPSLFDAPYGYDPATCGPWATTNPGWTLVPPTSIDPTIAPCSADWLAYVKLFDDLVKSLAPSEQRTLAESVAVMMTYMMTLPTATTPLQKALLTRAFFLHRSQGSFNPLFTGNGYTATGVGAVFAGESTELLFSPFFSKSLPPKAKATIEFCLNGVNGGVPQGADGNCMTLTPPAP